MFFVGLVLIWDTQQQPRTIYIITGLILRPKMGWNSPESNLQRGLEICLKNVKKGLFYSEYDSLYLHKRKISFSVTLMPFLFMYALAMIFDWCYCH